MDEYDGDANDGFYQWQQELDHAWMDKRRRCFSEHDLPHQGPLPDETAEQRHTRRNCEDHALAQRWPLLRKDPGWQHLMLLVQHHCQVYLEALGLRGEVRANPPSSSCAADATAPTGARYIRVRYGWERVDLDLGELCPPPLITATHHSWVVAGFRPPRRNRAPAPRSPDIFAIWDTVLANASRCWPAAFARPTRGAQRYACPYTCHLDECASARLTINCSTGNFEVAPSIMSICSLNAGCARAALVLLSCFGSSW